MELQQKLNSQGASPPLKVDGIFGPKTRAAVVNFQKTHQDSIGKPLVPDGVVGKLTWGALQAIPGGGKGGDKPANKPPKEELLEIL